MADRMDMLLEKLGTGKWHILHFIAIFYSASFPAPHSLGSAYLAPRQDYYCDAPPEALEVDSLSNRTSMPSCSYSVLNKDGSISEEPCTQWIFDNSTFTHTVTTEFELVCEREYLRATYQSMYMLGVLVGAPINGLAADRFGRRTVFVAGALLFTLMAIVSSWMPNLSSVLLFRILLGTMHPTLLKIGYVLVIEISNPKMRPYVGAAFHYPWTFGTLGWVGLAYFVRTWRSLQLYASLPYLILIPALWFLDESPRWLAVQGQHEQALKVFKKLSRWNKVDLPPDKEILSILKECQDKNIVETEVIDDGTGTIKEKTVMSKILRLINKAFILYITPRLCFVSVIMHLVFFVIGMVFFGLSLGGSVFKSDPFIFMALMAFIEIPAIAIIGPATARFGPRLPLACSLAFTAVVLLFLAFLPISSQTLVMTFALLGKMTISMAFPSASLYASELSPTEVRSRGLSTSFMFSRLGSVISPFITEFLGVEYPWAPSLIFGGAAGIAAISTLLLWETKGMAMPDTINHFESNNFKLPPRYQRFKLLAGKCKEKEETGTCVKDVWPIESGKQIDQNLNNKC